MLRDGYMLQKSYHILATLDPLAQLLHCVVEAVACPIGPSADADSRFDACSVPAAWTQAARSGGAADLTRRDHVQRFSVQRFRPVLRGPKRNRYVDGGISGVVSRRSDAIRKCGRAAPGGDR